MTLKVIEVTAPADAIIAKGNMFNATPAPDQQYIIVKLELVCMKTADQSCSTSMVTWKLIDSAGNVYDYPFIAGIQDELRNVEFFGGATKTGIVVFLAPKDDTGLILEYSEIFNYDYFMSLY